MARKTFKSVLVVGGGIAGIQTSLDLTEAGYFVYLVEKTPALGGVMPMLGRTFPTNDCSMCILSPKLVECGRHPYITVLTLAEVLSVEGGPGNFKAKVKLQPRGVRQDLCKDCGECAMECPVQVDYEFNQDLDFRKAVFKPYPQAYPSSYAIDRDNCIRCQACLTVCPAGAVDLDGQEKIIDLNVGAVVLCPGFELVHPASLGPYRYQAHYPSVLTALEFERLLSASGPLKGKKLVRPSDAKEIKKIAWVQCAGSRSKVAGRPFCSAVCCMYAIKQAVVAKEQIGHGFSATIFYTDARVYGKGFEKYYRQAKESGVRFVRCNLSDIKNTGEKGDLRVSYTAEDGAIREEVFELVILSTGMAPPELALASNLGLNLNNFSFCETEAYSGVNTARAGIFVAGAYSGPRDVPDTVMQASAAAGAVAAVLGPAHARAPQLLPEKEVGGEPPRLGVVVCSCGGNISRTVKTSAVLKEVGRLPGIVCATEFTYACSQDSLNKLESIIQEHNLNRVVVAACSPRTHRAVFQNILRQSGLNIHLFEMANIRDQCSWVHSGDPEKATEKAADLVKMAAVKAALLEPLQSISVKVEPAGLVLGGGIAGLTCALNLAAQGHRVHLVEKSEQLGGNARSLAYGLRGEDVPKLLQGLIKKVSGHSRITLHLGSYPAAMEGYVGNFVTTLSSGEKIKHGVTVIATGARENKPEGFLYGNNSRVLTTLELEEKMAAGDPSIRQAAAIAFIQCAGTRNKKRPYCSRVCCGMTVRLILQLKRENPQCRVVVFYRDMVTYGFLEQFYQEVRDLGVVFARYPDEQEPVVEETAGQGAATLKVTAVDTSLGRAVSVQADIVALASGIVPAGDNRKLSQMFKVPLNEEGFFLEAHLKLRPVDFAAAGIFMGGLAHSPKNVEESIIQAKAAAARAGALLGKKTLSANPVSAVVNPAKCQGCLTCVRLCPFNAPKMVKNRARIEPLACQGCGVCAGECPNKAIELLGYGDHMFNSMLKHLFS